MLGAAPSLAVTEMEVEQWHFCFVLTFFRTRFTCLLCAGGQYQYDLHCSWSIDSQTKKSSYIVFTRTGVSVFVKCLKLSYQIFEDLFVLVILPTY